MGAFRVIFTGGEALLRKDIFDMIAWAHELGLLTFLETNGPLCHVLAYQRESISKFPADVPQRV